MIDHHEADVRVAEFDRDRRMVVGLEVYAADWQQKAGEAALGGYRALSGELRHRGEVATAGAARRRGRLVAASGLTELHIAAPADEPADSCALQDCRSGERPTSPPPAFQTYATPVCRDVEETVVWLRWSHPEMWWRHSSVALVRVARWLLALRQRCWEGRWQP